GVVALPINQSVTNHLLLRRWDQLAGDPDQGGLIIQPNDGGAVIVEGDGDNGWLNLEDGIQIQFPPGGATYRPGDYWLIPARVATGDIEWPRLRDAQGNLILDNNNQPIPQALDPHGIEHHYAPLGVISVDPNGTISAQADLRRV